RGDVWAAVGVEGGQPRGPGVEPAGGRCRPRVELRRDGGPVDRGQPIRTAQVDDLHVRDLLVTSASAGSGWPRPVSGSWPAPSCRLLPLLRMRRRRIDTVLRPFSRAGTPRTSRD